MKIRLFLIVMIPVFLITSTIGIYLIKFIRPFAIDTFVYMQILGHSTNTASERLIRFLRKMRK